ncbi:hypothetical protein WDW89_26205 [Deltaproteobacteria bacterium TL4]
MSRSKNLKSRKGKPSIGYRMLILGCVFGTLVGMGCSEGGNPSSKKDNAQYTIGGTVTGLDGNLVLALVLGDPVASAQVDASSDESGILDSNLHVAVHENLPFEFKPVKSGTLFTVKVWSQPSHQTCTPERYSESTTKITGDIINADVTCVNNKYSVSVSVTGLEQGKTLVLQNNGRNDLTIEDNKKFQFTEGIGQGGVYHVTVQSEPQGQTCVVSNAKGVSNAENVNVGVTCTSKARYSIGGTVVGLLGTVTIQNNGVDLLPLSVNGTFQAFTVPEGGRYQVSVSASSGGQTCTASNNTGLAKANVTDVVITCSFYSYTLSGTVNNLVGTLVLQNNGVDTLSIPGNGSFSFPAQVAAGAGYEVIVKTQPEGKCHITNATGIISANVSNVTVDCWNLAEGSAARGINKNSTENAFTPQFTLLDGQLYATWSEVAPLIGTSQIRLAYLNASDSWIYVDGNGDRGINLSSTRNAVIPQMIALGGQLYVTWAEANANQITQIRVAQCDGLFFCDNSIANNYTGLNKALVQNATNPNLAVLEPKLYATWSESDGTATQIRVAVFDGTNTWSFVDGDGTTGINKVTTANAVTPQLIVFGSNLYATWSESDGTATQIRVVVYNGNDSAPVWTFVDGDATTGINKDRTKNANNPRLVVLEDTTLYATWAEHNGNQTQIRVAVYNGDDLSPTWAFVDGDGVNGINKDVYENAANPELIVYNSHLYATWAENNGQAQVRIARFNGIGSTPLWSFIDGDGVNGLNINVSKSAGTPKMAVFGDTPKLYAIWSEIGKNTQSQIRVVKSPF